VRAILDVPIDRPRDRATIGKHPVFEEVQSDLMTILSEDAVIAA
jgi:hypothetical protein